MAGSPTSLRSLMTGYWAAKSIYVVAKLGVADLLAAGPRSSDELAKATNTQPEALYRLMRALATHGIFREESGRRFSLTSEGEGLKKDAPGSQHALALMMGEEHYQCWGELLYSVQTGRSAFEKIYGEPIFTWLGTHPEQAHVFDQSMTAVHGRETGAMLADYDFSGIRVLADVGGGNGSTLAGVLERYGDMRGMLCDLPGVVERAKAGVAEHGLTARMQLVPTDFFAAVPTGADAYMMRHIIHDWNDEQSRTILRNTRKAIPADGRLLIVECVIGAGGNQDWATMLDLNMMVIPGGKERTEAEYKELFAATGFRLEKIVPTRADVSVIEARPV